MAFNDIIKFGEVSLNDGIPECISKVRILDFYLPLVRIRIFFPGLQPEFPYLCARNGHPDVNIM